MPSSTLDEQIAEVMSADDLSGSLRACRRYPRLPEKRSLSKFELELRDWGLVYGLVFGLAWAEDPDEPNYQTAERAYVAARKAHARWAEAIADPQAAREAAVRDVLRALDDAEERAEHIRAESTRPPEMTHRLHDALVELAFVEGMR